MNASKLTHLLVIASISAIGCSSDSGETAGIAVQAVSQVGTPTQGDLVFVDDGSTEFTLTEANLNVRDIKLDLPDGVRCADIEADLVGATCSDDSLDSEDTVEIEGPFAVDLVTGVSTPSLDDIEIPALTYRRLDIRVDDNADDISFSAVADFDLDGDAVVLELALDFNEDIRVEGGGGVTVDADTDLIAEFAVANWLAGIDVASCINDGDLDVSSSTVVISDATTEGSCSDIEDTIKNNMKDSGQLDRR